MTGMALSVLSPERTVAIPNPRWGKLGLSDTETHGYPH